MIPHPMMILREEMKNKIKIYVRKLLYQTILVIPARESIAQVSDKR
jgi:hypothetical protein